MSGIQSAQNINVRASAAATNETTLFESCFVDQYNCPQNDNIQSNYLQFLPSTT